MTITNLERTSCTSSLAADGSTQYILKYNAYFTGPWDPVALEAPMTVNGETLPQLYTRLVGPAGAFGYWCVSKTTDLVDLYAGLAQVVCTFKSGLADALSGNRDLVSWNDSLQQREVCYTQNNKAIVNSANQLFASNAVVPFMMPTFTVTGIRTTVKAPPVSQWKIVNSGNVSVDGASFSDGQCWITGFSAEEIIQNGGKQYLHRWTCAVAETHDLVVPDMGTGQLDDSNKLVAIRGGSGQPLSTPWPLNNHGKALAAGFTAEQVYNLRLTFKMTNSIDFSMFGWHF